MGYNDDATIAAKAPWAEVVPGVGVLESARFLAWREAHAGDGYIYELVDGRLMRRVVNPQATAIAQRLAAALSDYVAEHDAGSIILNPAHRLADDE
jgi:hypothetical protein